MTKLLAFLSIALFMFTACNVTKSDQQTQHDTTSVDRISKVFDLQGHRGARGFYPENTLPAFLEAVNRGVRTIELDVVVSADSQLVVSHEPFLNHTICLDTAGKAIAEADEKKWNIYQMTMAQVRKCDCGSLGNPNFKEQKKRKVSKPALSIAIRAIEAYVHSRGIRNVYYNIETKSRPEWDSTYHPAPTVFARLLFKELSKLNVLHRAFIQSFDIRTLQAFKKLNPQSKLVLLVSNKLSFEENLQKLGFAPAVYSPYYQLVTPQLIAQAHARQIQVIPWTVNTQETADTLKKMGVDGLITDYPGQIK
ncbi:glycerophosphodiester phosphodiesterase family protein [Microscilla marina]|uniref:Glycerophosphoryl diester phosphodiesterase n=1 Tax=Microscilla marina ATCC 23134 TaxID=313606 RepID=A1ZPD6_MICM2|nr:glycerophosphodiester phosphodiesterase family protein [Microscilla marina]EAY27675.1 glycerophosphoryl diester phosphodiesterase [Microscilla marina ATCC 23134]